jgi:DNA primase
MKPGFAKIKATTDIVRVVESYGVALKKSGADYVGLCPFHDDGKPSLHVKAPRDRGQGGRSTFRKDCQHATNRSHL